MVLGHPNLKFIPVLLCYNESSPYIWMAVTGSFMVICMSLKVVCCNFSTVEEEIFVGQEDDPELLDDFDFEQNEDTPIKDKDVYKQKLKRRASQYKVHLVGSQALAMSFTFFTDLYYISDVLLTMALLPFDLYV